MSRRQVTRAELFRRLDREMRQVSAYSVLLSQAVAERAGIHPTDLEILDLLHLEGPVPAGRLAEVTGLTAGAITGAIDRLERRGYIRREDDPNDRRRVIVRPVVSTAQRTIIPLYAALSRAMTSTWSRYSDKDLAVLLDFMARSSEIARKHIARLRKSAAATRRRHTHEEKRR
jgi:DNA-binding MarR family transcriptional regulator